jgi:CRP/FNR family transcriptional regulator, nitrogen oxide reductase regulator
MTPAEAFDRVPFLKALGPGDRERLAPRAQVKVLSSGDGCWTEGAPAEEFLFVLEGRVKMVKASERGRDTIVEMGEPGQLLCGNAVFCSAPWCCRSESMEDGTAVLSLPRRDVLDLVERAPQAARGLVQELTRRGLDMCRRLEEVGSAPVERRIAALLLKLGDRAGVRRAPGGVFIPVRLSRQDIAELCDVTVETAIRVMSRFNKAGVVRTSPRGFLVPDRAALQAIATR